MSVFSLPSEDWRAVTRRVARADGPIAWAWMAFHDPNMKRWELGLLSVRGATETEKRMLRYPTVVIATEQLKPRTAAQRLRAGRAGSPRTLGGALVFDVESQRQFFPQWMTSEADDGLSLVPVGWPQYFVSRTGINPSSGTLPVRWTDPLHAPGMPFYPGAQAAVAELLYGLPPTGIPTNMSQHVLIRLPDLQARIQPATFKDGTVCVRVEEGKLTAARGCVLHTTWRQEPWDIHWCWRDVCMTEPGEVSIETGEIPAEMWMLLTAPDGQILDRYGWRDTSVLQPEQTGDLVARVERWIQDGETLTVELKQELGSDKVNRSFAETVTAFANGRGGVILVGVADDRTVIGWDRPDAVDRITTIVRTLVAEYVAVDVRKVEVQDKPVQVVTVPAGDPAAKPYRCDGVVMIRANR